MIEGIQTPESLENTGDISVQLASPDVIRDWSYGEVTKPETINYRSYKPEKDGLFCEKIFGPVKNWECSCGKYKRIRYRGVVCDRCGVEVTHSKVRRERMGHIELAIPVVHIWFFKSLPSTIALLLNEFNPKLAELIEEFGGIDKALQDVEAVVSRAQSMEGGKTAVFGLRAKTVTLLERVIYYESYIVLDPGTTERKRGELITEEEYEDLETEGRIFDAKMGAPAIKQMLAALNMQQMADNLRLIIKAEKSAQKKADALKRLKVVNAFKKSENRPEWMIIDVMPVIPPDLRPLVPLEGGRFATSDLNDLYRRVINRNNRLKKLIDIKAPEVILRNEKRMLQEAVDVLFDNGRRTFSVKGEGRRPLKSLSELLKGKQGRFRQNLLGKRVDYSGRSVIVVGPELRMEQCGIPKGMALELYKPFIIQKLEEEGYVHTVKSAKKFVEKERPEVWDILEQIIDDHPVLLNRAPTLHRLGIQAFYPKLIEGKAIRLHPLVCAAFNADFDGDQMAVHLPLSFETQLECRVLMLSSNNILHPASGQPLAVPSQDIVLGLYFMSKPRIGMRGEGMSFLDAEECERAYDAGYVTLNTHVKIRLKKGIRIYSSKAPKDMCVEAAGVITNVKKGDKLQDVVLLEDTAFDTTPGRGILNQVLPAALGYANETFDKKLISRTVDDLYRRAGNQVTVDYLDALKDTGFKWAMRSGASVSISDMLIPPEKYEMIRKTEVEVEEILNLYNDGVITDGERYNKIIDKWSHITNDVASLLFTQLERDEDGFNPVFMMAHSGARGSREQIKQLSGMRGLMQKPAKKLGGQEVIENPIKSSFREGLNVLEYFISTHGARKGLADTALKTADAGYLTRRLVDVAQDVVITIEDCGTVLGLEVRSVMDGDDEIQSLSERILGRVAAEDLMHPVTDEVIVSSGQMIDEDKVLEVEKAKVEFVKVRSVLTCESIKGVCSKCYGRNLASGRDVDLGEAVGVLAAQSIGEPGTQLTLRTFHIGGASSRLAIENAKRASCDGKVVFEGVATVRRGDVEVVVSRSGELILVDEHGINRDRYPIPYGAELSVVNEEVVTGPKEDKKGKKKSPGQLLFEWDPFNSVIITNAEGKVSFDELVKDSTFLMEYNEATGIEAMRVTVDRKGKLRPHINIMNGEEKVARYSLPEGAYVQVKKGQKVGIGEVLVKIPRAAGKTRDITGGLPRVAELFEARIPKNAATIAPINGFVEYGKIERGQQRIIIRDEHDSEYSESTLVPRGKHISVHEGDRVRAGDKLCEGSPSPHEILKTLGVNALQEYLVSEIQVVYRLQGVTISDKHIECIVRQMLRKVRVINPGETSFLEQEEISRMRFRVENEKMFAEGKTPATFAPMLLGITKSSLATDSFISAASFQETTKVLTRAAVAGSKDELVGLKENVIMGRLIPSGTGAPHLRDLKVRDLDAEESYARQAAESEDDLETVSIVQEGEKTETPT